MNLLSDVKKGVYLLICKILKNLFRIRNFVALTTFDNMRMLKVFLLIFIFQLAFFHLCAQTTQEEFGQNRVQYSDFNWSFYKSDRFAVYFHLGGQDLGKFVITEGEREIESVEDALEYKLNDNID
ncbi:MAG: hypothetical protein WCI97_13490, partial [Bacteroidota bacterium]